MRLDDVPQAILNSVIVLSVSLLSLSIWGAVLLYCLNRYGSEEFHQSASFIWFVSGLMGVATASLIYFVFNLKLSSKLLRIP